VTRLEHRVYGYAKGLLALVALVHARARTVAPELGDSARIGVAAVRAEWAIGPEKLFEMFPSLVRVAVDRIDDVHGRFPIGRPRVYRAAQYVKYIIA
jgi:hypothetical protein